MTSITQPPGHHVAEVNIGRLLHAQDDPRVAEFMDNLARINAVADRSPGFVWRLQGDDEATGAMDVSWPGDPQMNVNLSVWESPNALEDYVWRTVHKRFYQKKGAWFAAMETPHFAMWWTPIGHRPTVVEAKERLDHLVANGPTEHAFGWESLPSAAALRAERCA